MNVTWTFHHRETGVIAPSVISLPEGCDPAPNTPADHVAVDAKRDWRTQRVDVASGKLVAYQPPADAAALSNTARLARDRLLAASDWTQLPDAPIDEAARAAWATYRAALRDVTAQAGFPADVAWPALPAP